MCLCLHAHVCMCVWRRENRFLTFTSKILALKLREFESVCLCLPLRLCLFGHITHQDLITCGPHHVCSQVYFPCISPTFQMLLKFYSYSVDLKSVRFGGKCGGLSFLNYLSFLQSLLPQLYTNKTISALLPVANFGLGF